MARKKGNCLPINKDFINSAILNADTFSDYLYRIQKICLSMFEWVNLPSSMDERWLEKCLFFQGSACLLKTEKYGFINTQCSSSGTVNIYGIPTSFNCYSYEFNEVRRVYTGLKTDSKTDDECILVMNNYDRIPTISTVGLFAKRLYEAERTIDVNVKAQKTPILVLCNEKQRLTLKNLYSQYDGNEPFIFGDKDQLNADMLKSINTNAPFVAKDLMEYKKQIWNELLTFLGINNLNLEKKERLVSDEANADNELINFNLQSFLAPRQLACKQFNEKFGLTGTDKEISVRVRSDLHNIIKQELSVVQDYVNDDIKTNITDEVSGVQDE